MFVITTQDEDAVVTISMPATGEVLATVNIAANSLEVVTVDTETVENKPLNQTVITSYSIHYTKLYDLNCGDTYRYLPKAA